MRRRPETSYAETAILTASREELVVKLYDGLIQFTRSALEKMREDPGEIEFVHNALRRSQRACALLMTSLDFEAGGEVAKHLFHTYEKWHHGLMLANMRQEPARLEELLEDFKAFRVTWARVVEGHNEAQGRGRRPVEAEAAT